MAAPWWSDGLRQSITDQDRQNGLHGVDYSESVAEDLVQSAKLLVVCSPNARAHSKYIGDEIRLFVGAHGARQSGGFS
jgi:hypothetical protein